MSYCNFKDIENSLTSERIIQLVTELGSDNYIEKPDCIIFKTICHNINPDDASMKLYYYKKNKKFHCYTDCGDNFGIFELFKRRYELLGIEYDFYKDIVLKITDGITKKEEDGFIQKYNAQYTNYQYNDKPSVNLEHINPSILNIYSYIYTPEWINDGISVQSMKEYGIKYSIIENKIIIPHYDENGFLVGIRGRALNEEDIEIGKYMPVFINRKCYAHPLGYNLYGLNLVKGNIQRSKMVIIAESEKSALQYNTMFGHENNICVAACGSNVSQYQIDLLLSLGVERILVAFDKEGENWKEKEKYYQKLKNICKKYSRVCNMGFIYDTKDRIGLKDSPFDKGKETFLLLYKEAIWI